LAIEVELTAKAPKRLEAILAAYALHRGYDAVHYLVDDPPVAKLIRRSAARTAHSVPWRDAADLTQVVIEPLASAEASTTSLIQRIAIDNAS
jgi:hypothetical protein